MDENNTMNMPTGHHHCKICSVLCDSDNKELTRFILDTLETNSISTLYEQIPVLLVALEQRQKQNRQDTSTLNYKFTEEEIHGHVHFCLGPREDAVLRLLIKEKVLRAMNDAHTVSHLVSLAKMLQQSLSSTRKTEAPN